MYLNLSFGGGGVIVGGRLSGVERDRRVLPGGLVRDGSSPRTAPWEVAVLWGAGDQLT